MNSLVVGSSGYLGRALSMYLQDHGMKVLGTSTKTDTNNNIHLNLEKADKFQIPSHLDFAVLCAGISGKLVDKNLEFSQKINVVGLSKLIDKLLSNNIKVIFISSSAVFNNAQNNSHEAAIPDPKSNYGLQKRIIESRFYGTSKLFSIVRPTKILSLDSTLFHKWRELSLSNQDIKVNIRSKIAPVDLRSLCEGIRRISLHQSEGIFHISGQSEITYEQLALEIDSIIGPDFRLQIAPYDNYIELSDSAHTLNMDNSLNSLNIKSEDISFKVENIKESLVKFWSNT